MNTVLLIFLIWIPDGGDAQATVGSDYVKQAYPTEAACQAAADGNTRIHWTNKAGHRMIGTKQCTDGSIPSSVTIGNMTVTVETVANVPAQ
jgi:hypothetical protein